MARKQTKGFCKYCGKEFVRSGMLRHLAACKGRKAALDAQTGKRKSGYFELVISGKYNPDYWLIVEMRETAILKDLDGFIRDIWVECCGHLSSFTIDGISYDSVPDEGSFWGPPSRNMDYKAKEIFSPGMVIGYEYDFGSTTELVIKVQNYRTGIWISDEITILSRNNPPEIPCCRCGKKADRVYPERYYEEDAFWCDECIKAVRIEEAEEELEEGEELDEYDDIFYADESLPVCNSPRMGVCGYDGSSYYPDQFEPDTLTSG